VAGERRDRQSARNATRVSDWPELAGLEDAVAEAEIGWVIDLISAVRSVRAEMNVPAGAQIPLALVTDNADVKARAGRWDDVVRRLARISAIDFPLRCRLNPCRPWCAATWWRCRSPASSTSRPNARAWRRSWPRSRPTSRASMPTRQSRLHCPRARGRGGGRAGEARGLEARRAKINEALARLNDTK